MFVSKKTYQALQKQYDALYTTYDKMHRLSMECAERLDEAELSVSAHVIEIERLNREIAVLAQQQDASFLLIKDCLAWMSEINLPKKTAGTAGKERRREKLCQEARVLEIGEQEKPDAT